MTVRRATTAPPARRSPLAGALTVAGIVFAAATMRFLAWPAEASKPLDLSAYRLAFDEPFDRLDVSPWGPGTRWIAHTPWNGDFGDAAFIDPTPDAPFTVAGGILTITMRKVGDHWQSGLLASVDRAGHGFAQSGGYFEVRAKLPPGAGVWPAFWLGSSERKDAAHPEIDVIEYYGHDPTAYMATVHLWRDGKSEYGDAVRISVPPHSLETGFHLFGVSIDPENTIFYLDRREVGRLRSRPEFLQPCYPMVNLGAGGGWPIAGMPDRSQMLVDHIRVYRRLPGGQAHPDN